MCDKANKIDLVVFVGQSNMAGRGNTAMSIKCNKNAGFEYKAISNPNELVPISEPFGLGEERIGGIYDINPDGSSKRTGVWFLL